MEMLNIHPVISATDALVSSKNFQTAFENVKALHKILSQTLWRSPMENGHSVDMNGPIATPPQYDLPFFVAYYVLSELMKGVKTNSQVFQTNEPPKFYFSDVFMRTWEIYKNRKKEDVSFPNYFFDTLLHGKFIDLRNENLNICFENVPFIWFQKPKKSSLMKVSKEFLYPEDGLYRNKFLLETSTVKISMCTLEFTQRLVDSQRYGFKTLAIQKNMVTWQYRNPLGLVFCNFSMDHSVETPPEVKDALALAKESRYGSVQLEFPIKELVDSGYKFQFYKLGTKRYEYEHSQVILVDQAEGPRPWYLIHEDKPHKLDRIEDPKSFYWDLYYNRSKGWTHPELAFVGCLNLPLGICTVSFAWHRCLTGCLECETTPENIRSEFAKRIVKESVQIQQLREGQPALFSKADFDFLVNFKGPKPGETTPTKRPAEGTPSVRPKICREIEGTTPSPQSNSAPHPHAHLIAEKAPVKALHF